jgi:hypothetical protein
MKYQVERWLHIMGTTQRLERVIPCTGCTICASTQSTQFTSISLVGSGHFKAMQTHS